jgi:Ca2+-binding RTX toxin-like protein
MVKFVTIDTGMTASVFIDRYPEYLFRNIEEIPGNGIDDDGNGYVDDVSGPFIGPSENLYFWDDELTNGHGDWITGVALGRLREAQQSNPSIELEVDYFVGGRNTWYAHSQIALNYGADVISYSLGFDERDRDSLEKLAQLAYERDAILVVWNNFSGNIGVVNGNDHIIEIGFSDAVAGQWGDMSRKGQSDIFAEPGAGVASEGIASTGAAIAAIRAANPLLPAHEIVRIIEETSYSALDVTSAALLGDRVINVDGAIERALELLPNGNLELTGSNSSDTLRGAEGSDTLHGFDGDDLLEGGEGHDMLYGEAGADRLFGGSGNDTLYGSSGTDLIEGNSGEDIIFGGDDNDKLNGGSGNDLLVGGKGSDSLEGGTGDDTIWTSEQSDGFFSGSAESISEDSEEIHSRNHASGGDGNDLIIGNIGYDRIHGQEGDDTIFGRHGRDEIFGGAGDDILSGGPDDDRISGGPGRDIFVMRPGDGTDRITDFENGASAEQGDKIDITAYGMGYDDILFEADPGGLRVRLGSDVVILWGVAAESLEAHNFLLAEPPPPSPPRSSARW